MIAPLVDTHTHLDNPAFDADREEVISRARAAGVKAFITIGVTAGFQGCENALALSRQYSDVFCSVGVHPHDATTPLDPERLFKYGQGAKVVAIGETGLDFFKDWSPRDSQYEWFRLHIQVAKSLKKPLVIHSRNAGLECLQVLVEEGADDCGGVFHCYAEDEVFAKRLVDINFKISLPGVITFKKATALREAVRAIPIEQIMLETDAPYLAPEPLRGKRCESSLMPHTAQTLATLKGLTLQEVALITTQNAIRFFNLPIRL